LADNIAVTPGTGATVATDDVGGIQYQRIKVAYGADGSATDVNTGSGFPVSVQNASLAVTGTFWQATQPVSLASAVAVTDNSGSLTVDAPAATPVAVRFSDGASFIGNLPVNNTQWGGVNVTLGNGVSGTGVLRVTVASDSTGVLGATQSGTWTVQPGNTANTTPWLQKISDGTNAAAIKAASTAPVATDPALVVSISPNSVNANGQATMANSAPVAIASNQSQLPVGLGTDTIYSGATALTPKFATIAASSSGNNTLIAAVVSKKIRVLSLSLMSNGTVNAKFQSGAGGTDLTGLYYTAANTGFVLPFNPVGHFETASNTLLNLNLSGAVAVGGQITYVEV
jgi:hypothetical protein